MSEAKPLPPIAHNTQLARCYRSAAFNNNHVSGQYTTKNMPKHVTLMF